MLDSAALGGSIQRYLTDAGISLNSGKVTLSYSFYPPDSIASLFQLQSDLPADQTDSIANLVWTFARRTKPSLAGNRYTLVLTLGSGLGIRANTSKPGPPAMLNREQFQATLATLGEKGYTGSVELLIRIGADGHIEETIVQKWEGSKGLDRIVVEMIKELQFKPGTIDGFPAPIYVSFPVSVQRR